MDHFEFEHVTAHMSPEERSEFFNRLSKRKQRKLLKSSAKFYRWMEGKRK